MAGRGKIKFGPHGFVWFWFAIFFVLGAVLVEKLLFLFLDYVPRRASCCK